MNWLVVCDDMLLLVLMDLYIVYDMIDIVILCMLG
jgi:hypothetical protein